MTNGSPRLLDGLQYAVHLPHVLLELADLGSQLGERIVRPLELGRPCSNDEFPTLAESERHMPTSGPVEATFAIRGPIARADLPGLCDRVCALLPQSGATVVCDVAGVDPDAVTVEALARLQLAACRHGCRVTLRNASEPLLELVELMGLSDVLSERRSPAAGRSAGTAARRRGRT